MAVTKAPKKPTTMNDQEAERRAEAFIAGGGSVPAAQPAKRQTKKRQPVTMKWDPELLERIDQAAERKGINRTAWVQYKLNEILDREGL